MGRVRMIKRSAALIMMLSLALSALLSSYAEAPALSDVIGDDLAIGDVVAFGVFEQDRNTDNGPEPIQWRVLTIDHGSVLLLSEYVIDNLQYNEAKGDITWEDSTIRQWLNDTFYSDAFSPKEKKVIKTTKLDNSQDAGNPKWNKILGGNDTEDKVFLLSYSEVLAYFEDYKSAVSTATSYAHKRGADEWFTDACTWWLRSPGRVQYDGCFVTTKGKPDTSSARDKRGIRPAIWVELASIAATPTPKPTPKPTPTPKVTPTPTPKPTPKVYNSAMLQGVHGFEYARGSKGDAVKFIQQMLIDQSFLPAGQADGSYGPKTEAAIARFQESNGLNPTGIANLSTQYRLVELETGFAKVDGANYEFAGLQRYGVYKFSGGIYIGVLRSDQSYQEGTQIYDDGTTYAGQFKNNQRSGKGEAWYPNGDYYSGNWSGDLMNGKGIYHFGSVDSIEQYDGEWVDGKMSGKGVYTMPDGSTIKGKWENNQQIGWWK